MKYKNLIINKFNGISEDLEVRMDLDMEEKRESPFTLTLIQKACVNLNPGLPDYRISFELLLDCFIADDRDGSNFSSFAQEIKRRCEEMSDRFVSISDRFDCPEVVGCYYNGSQDGLTNTSNQRKFNIDLIVSE